MNTILQQLKEDAAASLQTIYSLTIAPTEILINETNIDELTECLNGI
jgi:hypothetical protein